MCRHGMWLAMLMLLVLLGCSGRITDESEPHLDINQLTNGHFVFFGAIPMENKEGILKAFDSEGIGYEIGPLCGTGMCDFWVDPSKIDRAISLVEFLPPEVKRHLYVSTTEPRGTLRSCWERIIKPTPDIR